MLKYDEETKDKLTQIYVCYRKELFVEALIILHDYYKAEDIVQNTMLKIVPYLNQINDINSNRTKAYLFTIVKNACYDEYNIQKKIIDISTIDNGISLIEDSANVEDYILKVEERNIIIKKISQLHYTYCNVLILKFYYQLSTSEIAEKLKISSNNVNVRVNRALNALKKTM